MEADETEITRICQAIADAINAQRYTSIEADLDHIYDEDSNSYVDMRPIAIAALKAVKANMPE